jgi:ABC-2 type transport system permease protein
MMNDAVALSRRAVREMLRMPEMLFPTLFIPLFFLVVNVGQVGKIFPSTTEFLQGQSYAAFQMPNTLLLVASFGGAALFLVEEIEGGYFDKLRATPISRVSLISGRLIAEGLKTLVIAAAILLASMPFGIDVVSGPIGFLLMILLTAMWAIVYSGFLQIVALKSRSAAATNSAGMLFFPLLFLTPNFVPRDLLTRPMEVAASFNPVTYLMEAQRSLMLNELAWNEVWPGFLVLGCLAVVMVALSVRIVNRYD